MHFGNFEESGGPGGGHFFFEEEEGLTSTENAVSMNVSLFRSKFKGSVPVPKKFAPSWSVPIGKASVEVGGCNVEVSICRPAIAIKDGLNEAVAKFLSTVDPSDVEASATLQCNIDGTAYSVKEGEDFWTSTSTKLTATKALSWLA